MGPAAEITGSQAARRRGFAWKTEFRNGTGRLCTARCRSLELAAGILGALLAAGQISGLQSESASRNAARETRSAELDRQVAELEQQLERVRRQADDLLGQAGRARARAALQERRIERVQRQLDAIRMALTGTESDVARLEARRSALQRQLLSSARALHRFGDLAQLRLFFSLRRQTAPLTALRQLRYLTLRDARTLELLQRADRELRDQQAELSDQRGALSRELETEARLSRDLRSERAELDRLSRQLGIRRQRLEERTEGLQTRAARLARLMELLDDEGPSGLAERPIEEFRGGLDWPVEGEVVTAFGPRIEPRYGTRVMHNGIELRADQASSGGDRAAAVYPGRVIFAAPFQDLGFAVVLQHQQDVLTLYAGLAEVLVEEGDVLLSGDRLGRVTDLLYFEVRRDRKPEDPLDWLR